MNGNQTIGQYIRECREQIRMTLIEFAKRVELSKSYVSDVERGNRTVTSKRLAHMAYVIAESKYWGSGQVDERWLTIYHIMLQKSNLMSPYLKALKQIEDILDSKSKKKQKLYDIMGLVKLAYFDDLTKIELEGEVGNDNQK